MTQDQGHDLPSTLKPRRLLRGEITYAAAKEQDANILHELGYRDQKIRFFTQLDRNRDLIKTIVAHHLGLASTDQCRVVDVGDWIHGSFNVCIRVDVVDLKGNVERQVMIRFPLPYRIGEKCCPGNADEKVRCEVGTYAWLKENCPTVPIPHLYGFGLSSGKSFTDPDNLPFFTRNIQRLRLWLLQILRYPVPSFYVENATKDQTLLGTPYILIEYIDPSRGKMLSETWEEGRFNPTLRTNLFHGLSRIMLTLARIPLPKIGSFALDENGYLSLSNRPLTLEIQQLKNEQIPVDIQRHSTHTSVESFVHDTLSLHESRLRHQPNAVNSVEDGFYQTSALMVMRSIWPCFFRRDLLRGPFFLNLTDLNQSNVFVDDDWNIARLIDLEWACSHPVDMIHPPHWLTNQAVDLINLDEYKTLHAEFLDAFAEEEKKLDPPFRLCPIMKQGLENGTFWCSLALANPTALFKIFYDHIQLRFSQAHDDPAFWRITMPYWSFNTFDFIEQKVKDKERYDTSLREAFQP
ncbi:hypothetical protein N7466_006455 [Penicillium verhagenii]|uniref:uncharacterized protein n=1 Tax=Penicillium verhagenii TaxID=1562060 RepID=UPI002545489E|nr:uncharacterized protein N7466_006455 [Penicillium verhagenii]KAJ5930962.1 hypothetical protein N7466_006455 [Penicillium verhagenii]